jgi:L-ascorbate metabolism protein UlaG (beta-lactamase superfamily)
MNRAELSLISNEGFLISSAGLRIFIDAFLSIPSGMALPPASAAKLRENVDLILVTHSHWDHFDPSETAAAALHSSAPVAGPAPVIRALRGKVPPENLIELEPPETRAPALAGAVTKIIRGISVTALRTFHGKAHNSYLIDISGFRLFHDGDNEDTTRIDVPSLGPVDLLLFCPWQGSGWVSFIERLKPRNIMLMHLTDEETAQHESGRFLPDLAEMVPPDIRSIRPGETRQFE